MTSLGIIDFAFRQNEWLAKRQTVIASNIVNANTPGYQAKDVTPFEAVMRESASLASTNSAHFTDAGPRGASVRVEAGKETNANVSGNSVNIESEFLKSSEVTRSYSVNSQIIKAFHRMVMLTAKV